MQFDIGHEMQLFAPALIHLDPPNAAFLHALFIVTIENYFRPPAHMSIPNTTLQTAMVDSMVATTAPCHSITMTIDE